MAAGHRRDNHDGAARCREGLVRRPGQEPRRARVHGKHAVPVIDRVSTERARPVDPGVAHEAVQTAEAGDRLADDTGGSVDAAHIAVQRERLGALSSEILD